MGGRLHIPEPRRHPLVVQRWREAGCSPAGRHATPQYPGMRAELMWGRHGERDLKLGEGSMGSRLQP